MRIDYDPAAEDFVLSHGPRRVRFLLDPEGIETLILELRSVRAAADKRHQVLRPSGLTSPAARAAIDAGAISDYIANGGLIQQCGPAALPAEPKRKHKLSQLEIADILKELDSL